MNDIAFALLALVFAVGGLGIIVWQWRTGGLVDPIYQALPTAGSAP
jgi:hypothetical protein